MLDIKSKIVRLSKLSVIYNDVVLTREDCHIVNIINNGCFYDYDKVRNRIYYSDSNGSIIFCFDYNRSFFYYNYIYFKYNDIPLYHEVFEELFNKINLKFKAKSIF